MNSLIEALNVWAARAFDFAWPMLWQSSLLIGLLFAMDILLRRKARPAVRYTLWLMVLVKLLLPPSLALPTSAGWWLRPVKVAPSIPRPIKVVVSYGAAEQSTMPALSTPVNLTPPLPPRLTALGWAFVGTAGISFALLLWILVRWQEVIREVRRAEAAPQWLLGLFPKSRRPFRLRLTDAPQSPAVCGLFRTVILLPRSLAEQLPPAQLRAVLLHEVFHLRRGDVWVNCAQALLQVVYWWHPLLWLANARIRRVREEAVDDAVMLALKEDAETYVPTLLEVAKLALQRPLASLGLVGILESRSSLRQRIERLMDFRPPRRAGLGVVSALGVLGFAALAVPMGEAPALSSGSGPAPPQNVTSEPAAETSSNAGLVVDKEAGVKAQVQDGKLLYEMGKLDEAQAKLKLALNEDPQNQAALYYFALVWEAKTRGARARSPDNLPVPDAFARSNLVHTSQARKALLAKLNSICFDTISFDGQPLSEVVRRLADECRKRDPDKVGINFVVVHGTSTNAPGEGDLDPWTGLPKAAPSATAVPLLAHAIMLQPLQPALVDVRLADVLDAIVKLADRPIKYTIEDYAVVFSPKTQTGPELYVRSFKVDPNALAESLGVPKGPPETNASKVLFQALRDNLTKAGVDLDPVRCPAKAFFYSDRQGMLLVRATMQELDTIEQIIEHLNTVPPQINIKARFVEILQSDAKDLGFDWYLGNARSGPITIGILNEQQHRMVLHALEQRAGAEVLAQPQVTVSSGRQVQCKVTAVQSVVTGVNERALKPPGLTGTNNPETALYSVEEMEFGPVLDVRPTVLQDGYTINLPLVVSSLQFLGYDDSRTNRVTVYVNGNRKQVNVPLPLVRSAQISSQTNLWDGQTWVLASLMSERIMGKKDALPLLGDLPRVDPLLRNGSGNNHKHGLLVFITPTIIDPAGNRVHAAEDTPADRIPPQPGH